MSSLTQPPALPSPSRRRRLLRYGVFGVICFITLLALALAFENWRGHRAWQKFRTESEAKGERFDVASFIPSPVPDEQNFALTPLLAPLLDYAPGRTVRWHDPAGSERAKAIGEVCTKPRGNRRVPKVSGQWEQGAFTDLREWQTFFAATNTSSSAETSPAQALLAVLKEYDADLEELRLASERPHSVFPVHYDENFYALLPHLAVLKGIGQLVRLRAVARMQAGQTNEALADVQFALRLSQSLKLEPLLISQLVRIAILNSVLQPLWEGLAQQRWTEAQLAEVQAALAAVKLLDDFGRTIRAERAFGNVLLEKLSQGDRQALAEFGPDAPFQLRFAPAGFIRQNQVTLNRLYQDRILPLVDAGQHRVFTERIDAADDVPELRKFHPYNIFAKLLYPAVAKTALKFAHGQTMLDLAVVACALERHRLAHGQHPETLAALAPRFLAALPLDVITGQPLHYERGADGGFTLYSVGPDARDDGGQPIHRKKSLQDPTETGDWVWHHPAGR